MSEMRSTTVAVSAAAAADVMREVSRALHASLSSHQSIPHSVTAGAGPVDRSTTSANATSAAPCVSASVPDLRAETLSYSRNLSIPLESKLHRSNSRCSCTVSLSSSDLAAMDSVSLRKHSKLTRNKQESAEIEALGSLDVDHIFPESFPMRVVAEFCGFLADDVNACDHEGLTSLYRAASEGSREHIALLLQSPEIDVDATCGRLPVPQSQLPSATTASRSPVPPSTEESPRVVGGGDSTPGGNNAAVAADSSSGAPSGVAAGSENGLPVSVAAVVPLPTVDTATVPEPLPAVSVPLTPVARRRRSRVGASAMGGTAALVAAFRGHYEILTELVAHGANLTLKNKLGFSVVKLAKMNVKVQKAIDAGRMLRNARHLAVGHVLLSETRELPVELAALIVSCCYQ